MIPLGKAVGEYDARAVSDATGLDTGEDTLVLQSFKDEVDINTIMRRFNATSVMPAGVAGGVFGDFSGIRDFDSAVEAIAVAERGFNVLPPEVRERFGNDPGRLIAFAQSVPESEFIAAVRPAVPGDGGVTPPEVSGS